MQTLKDLQGEVEIRSMQARLNVECPPDGVLNAELAVVAEAPGDREVAQGLPLVGTSGALLWKELNAATKLSRKDVYITNVSKRKLLLSDDTKKTINRHEMDIWSSIVRWELSQLPHLKYVLVMGNYALQAIAGVTGIMHYRGSVLEVDLPTPDGKGTRRVQVICTVNAAAVIREPKLEIMFKLDMAKVRRVINGDHKHIETNTIIYPSPTEVHRALERIRDEEKFTAYDIEVIANETACVGFSFSSTEAICIAFRDATKNFYSEAEEAAIRRDIQQTLMHPDLKIIAQNNAFDSSWLWFKDKIRVKPIWMDTMLAHHVLYPVLPHNLGFLTTQYTDHPYYKDDKKNWRDKDGGIETFWRYNGKDCSYTHAIAYRLQKELEQQHLADFFFNHVMRLQAHLVRMTVGGILIDVEHKAKLNETLKQTVGELYDKFQSLVQEELGDPDYTVNPKSPKQLSDLLFNKLKLVGRGSSTDEENRKRMYAHPRTSERSQAILQALGDYAKEQKFYSTYAESRIDEDNRMRCEYRQTGTQSAPGRLSSAGVLWGSGMNLQNQPDRAQEMFIADPGYGYAYFDLAQAEARYVGWDANIETWIEQFERARFDGSYDAHRALASDMFAVPYDDVPTFDRYDSRKHVIPEGVKDGDVTLRFTAKRCRHGLNYRMMPDRLATTTGLSLRAADVAFKAYHRITPELRIWWRRLEDEVRKTGTLFNSYGRRWKLMERPTNEALESIVAFKPQSTIGDHVCRVIYLAESDPRWPSDARMVLNVHDALIALAPLDKLKTCLSIMKAYAEAPIPVGKQPLIIPADCKVSYADETGKHRWRNLKAVDDIVPVKITL